MAEDWWRGAVIYQIYPRSFQDSNGDGIGDLPGITSRLSYVADLGADAVWLSPIFTSPMLDMGYDVSDYTDIDPLFGTLADFDDLIAEAKRLGLKVIIDQVLSHSSDKHPFFEESRSSREGDKADWYVWADPKPDGSPPNNWTSVFGGPAWEWEPRRQQFYLHNFLIEQPDFNCHNPAVQDWLLGTMRFWLDRGVDGFRLDTVNYYMHDRQLRDNPPEPREPGAVFVNTYDMQDHIHSKTQPENLAFIERMRALTDEYDARAMVGEVGEGRRSIEVMADYTRGENRLHMAYSFEMLGPRFSAEHFRSRISGFFEGNDTAWPCWSFSNHDVNRHVTRWAEHGVSQDALSHLSAALLVGFEGTIGVYQGDELGLTETDLEYSELTDPPGLRFWPMNKGRDGCRTPMVWDADQPHAGFSDADKTWLPVKEPQSARSAMQQAEGNDSTLHRWRELLAFRKAKAALVSGKTTFIDLPEPLFAFTRAHPDGGEHIACIYNLSPEPHVLRVNGGTQTGPSASAHLTGTELSLGPNGFAYFEAPLSEPITIAAGESSNVAT